jgi:phage protein D
MTETLDIKYYAPGFKIEIEGSELDPMAARIVESVTITKKLGQADYFCFRVTDRLKRGNLHLINDKLFKTGNRVTLSIGYRPNNFIKMQGHIEKVKPEFQQGVMASFEVEGKDKALARLAEESEYRCYTRKKDSDIVKSIACEIGLSPRVDTTPGPAPEKKEKKGGTSFLLFIQKMVRQNMGFEFIVTDGKLVFRKALTRISPVVSLEWGKLLRSFKPVEDLKQVITGVIVQWWDEKKREPIIGRAGINDEIPVGTGRTAGKIAKRAYGDIEKTITDEPVDSNQEAKNIAISVLCDTNKAFVTAAGETLGEPKIEPGVMIELKALGQRFSGIYYVDEVTHAISSDQYSTKFCVRRNTA